MSDFPEDRAFSDGVEPGGLLSRIDIELLVGYILISVDEPMPKEVILEVTSRGGLANYFDVGVAIEKLVSAGSAERLESGDIRLTGQGKQATSLLLNHLPYTVREKAVKIAVQLMARRRAERECAFTVEDVPLGCQVTCTVHDLGAPLMSVSLRLSDRRQTELVRENFLRHTALLYRSLLTILTDADGIREESDRIILPKL